MRGIETPISRIRRKVFKEIAELAMEDDSNLYSKIEEIPYNIIPGDEPSYRESIYRERAIVSERVRLGMGMSLRPEDRPVSITSGLIKSNISENYYEPPLMQVIPSACEKCEHNKYMVSDMCRNCVAHPCQEVCPMNAISIINNRSHIDQSKCIKCGKCANACPYSAIIKKVRPCTSACGVDAITSDDQGRAKIDPEKCVSCGMCMASCPFGAIADKSQIYQLVRCLKENNEVIAEIAPAFVGQFGPKVSPSQVRESLIKCGFKDVYEVALGADIGAVAEAKHYAEEVATGHLPVLLTSCCPAWSMMVKKGFPDLHQSVSMELTPMVATARSIKQKYPNAKVVFIGPCAAKKLEAMRTSVRSDVDFVLTFEELAAIFEAKNIVPSEIKDGSSPHNATGAGRGYAVSGGVAQAITNCVNTYYPDVEVKTHHVEGLAECKKICKDAKAGKMDGYLIEGMACPGGCVAGVGTLIDIRKAQRNIKNMVASSSKALPDKELSEIKLD